MFAHAWFVVSPRFDAAIMFFAEPSHRLAQRAKTYVQQNIRTTNTLLNRPDCRCLIPLLVNSSSLIEVDAAAYGAD